MSKDMLKRFEMMLTWMTCSLLFLPYFTLQSEHVIKKRNILQFGSMIETITGKKAIAFNEYGNYCGIGGSGKTIDEIDNCCKEHDICYQHVSYICYHLVQDYMTSYKWTYKEKDIKCEDKKYCKQALCDCDRKAALCFAENIASYKPKHLNLWGKLLKKFLNF